MSEPKSVEELLTAIALDPVLFVESILQASPEEWHLFTGTLLQIKCLLGMVQLGLH